MLINYETKNWNLFGVKYDFKVEVIIRHEIGIHLNLWT